MNARPFILVGICIGAVAGCHKETSDKSPSAAASASASVVLTDEALDQAAIPVKEDFEEQAEKTITSDNLEEQLSQLEKEIKDDH